MSLNYCPECSHEISEDAVTCPNCGRPLQAPPVVERPIIITPRPRERSFPPWAIVPIVLLGIILLFVGYIVIRQSRDQANTNVNVNLTGRRSTEPARESRLPDESQPGSVPAQTTNVPGTRSSPPNVPPPDRGTVVINAQIVSAGGAPQAARSTKFYLLDKDLETILNEARLDPIDGNDLTGSLGLAIVFPDRYGDFQRAAMKAISGHAKYAGTTSATGAASIKGVVPSSYSLFAISRVGRGFVLWNSPVSVIVGENVMNLSPQNVTEIPDPAA